MDHPFRNAAFGGFHKQDVLSYLETTSKENAQKLHELQQQLEQAQQEQEQLRRQLREREARTGALEQELDRVRREQELLSRQVDEGRETEQAQGEELERLQRERDELKLRVEALEPDAAAYAAIKERSAGVELDAHRRAQGVLDEADQQVRQLRQKMEQWLSRVQREYDNLCTQVESTVSHAADELGQAERALEQVNRLMSEQSIALEALNQAYADSDPVKVAAPMPIPEN